MRRKKFELSIPVRLNSQDVTVVPILAPIIMPIACESFIMPEFTNPTTITVVADDDWMTAVTPAPSSTALIGFDVRLSKIFSSLPPDIFSRPLPITLIPYKNIARPPTIVSIPKISIFSLPLMKVISFRVTVLILLYPILFHLATQIPHDVKSV